MCNLVKQGAKCKSPLWLWATDDRVSLTRDSNLSQNRFLLSFASMVSLPNQGQIQNHLETGILKFYDALTRNCAQTDAQIHWIAKAIHGQKKFSTMTKTVYLCHKICCHARLLVSLSWISSHLVSTPCSDADNSLHNLACVLVVYNTGLPK